jgi:hypothetical protein
MHRAQFSAAVQGGHGFPGIQKPLRVERFFQGVKLFQFRGRELFAHRVDFLHSDTVFTGHRSAGPDAHAQYFSAEIFGLFQFTVPIGVVKDQGVQIPVTGMEYIGDRQTIPL